MSIVTSRRVRGTYGSIRLGAMPGSIPLQTAPRTALYQSAQRALRPNMYRVAPVGPQVQGSIGPVPSFQPSMPGQVSREQGVQRGSTPDAARFFDLPGMPGPGGGGIFAGPGSVQEQAVHPPNIVDVTGEVVDEVRGPGTVVDPALSDSPLIDMSPSMVPSSINWKTWVPIGLAVVGIGAAVWILRRKK